VREHAEGSRAMGSLGNPARPRRGGEEVLDSNRRSETADHKETADRRIVLLEPAF
jgi:hypothetical protein